MVAARLRLRSRTLARSPLLHLVAALLAFAGACSTVPTEAALPRDAVPMATRPQFALWWRVTEQCSGLTGDLNAVSWYVVPGVFSMQAEDGANVQGLYFPVSRRIVLAGSAELSGRLVRHEMLHALLQDGGHPTEQFQRRCAGIVICDSGCVRDGTPRPAADGTGPIVRPEQLALAASVDPVAPSQARDSGYFLLTVSVTNPRAEPVRLRLTPVVPGYFASATFGVARSPCTAPSFGEVAEVFAADSIIVLGPGETLRQGFDQRTLGACALVRPTFNGRPLADLRVSPTP